MPIHLHDNDGNTSVNSMEALNKNLEKFIEIDYFTQVEIDEEDDSGDVKVPEL